MKSPAPIRFLLLAAAAVGVAALIWWSRGDSDAARADGASDTAAAATATAAAPSAKAGPVVKQGAATASTPRRASSRAAGKAAGAPGLASQLQEILAIPQQSERRQALEDLAGALARSDPAAARELLKAILAEKGEASPDAYAFASGFASDYAALNPKAASEWAESLPLTLQFNALSFVAKEWAKADLPAATAWAEKISDLSLRTQVLRRIGQELEGGVGEPKAVAVWAQRLAGSADAAQHTELISRLWAKGDAQGAVSWSTQLEDPARRTAAVVAIAGAFAEQNPQAASTWVGQFPAGELRNQAANAAATKWSESDPEAAARWLVGLGDQQLLETAARAIAGRWLQTDRAKATEWIRSSPISQQTKDYLLPGR